MGRYQMWVQALIICGDREPDARVADQIPPDEIRVPAVIRVGERALDRMRPHQVEKR